MSQSKEVQHWKARLDLWWAGVMQSRSDRRAENAAARTRQIEAGLEHRRKLAEGDLSGLGKGWYQHPKDPPGYQRWWNGDDWAEQTRQSPYAAKAAQKSGQDGLVMAGWISFGAGLFFWAAFIASFVIGIILAAKGRAGHGAALIILSLIGPIVSIAFLAAYLSGS